MRSKQYALRVVASRKRRREEKRQLREIAWKRHEEKFLIFYFKNSYTIADKFFKHVAWFFVIVALFSFLKRVRQEPHVYPLMMAVTTLCFVILWVSVLENYVRWLAFRTVVPLVVSAPKDLRLMVFFVVVFPFACIVVAVFVGSIVAAQYITTQF